MAQQADPSMGVPQELMAHVHLISSFRYPMMAQANLQEVAKWLMGAPHVARDKAPFFWTFLDKPENGTIMMTWQPLQRLGTNFATDGFVWAPPEQLYKHDLGNGLIMEIYYLKAGYAPGEPLASRARRRFRLVPVPGQPIHHHPDPNLFIVHYGPSEPAENIPSHVIPYDERVNATMQARHYVIQGGQLRRKEFMLSDRGNWPSLPEVPRQAWGRQLPPRQVPQQMAYPPQTTPGPPAKRARHAQGQAQAQAQPPPPQPPHHDGMLEDDEDITRGDMFDLITPKDLSLQRFKQNHEWMEEILSSPYKMNQITPPDLNLGLTGELASLTKGIFEAQGGDAWMTSPEKPYVGRLEPGKADEFRKRVDKHIIDTKAEIEKMREDHARALAKFKERSILSIKEKELRTTIAESGADVWRLELSNDAVGEGSHTANEKSVDEITHVVEEVIGRKIQGQPDVKCIKNGGWQAPAPEPEAPTQNTQMSHQVSQSGFQTNGMGESEADVDMEGTAAGLLDQMHTGFSSGTTPINSIPTPQTQISATQSNAPTPSQPNTVASPAVPQPASASGADVTMGGTPAQAKDQSPRAPDQGTGSGDWVVVPKSGETPEANPQTAGSTPKLAPPTTSSVKGPSNAGTPAVTDGGFDQNDFSSLGDLDTAGDALAGYGDSNDIGSSAADMGDGLDLNMDMDDSAFGDAFHGVSASGTPGDNGQGTDM